MEHVEVEPPRADVVHAEAAADVDVAQRDALPRRGGRRPGERVCDEAGVRGRVEVVGHGVQVVAGRLDAGQRAGQRHGGVELRLVDSERRGGAGHPMTAGQAGSGR